MRIFLSLLLVFLVVIQAMAGNDNKNKPESAESDKMAEGSYLNKVNMSLNHLYDSVNIWWKSEDCVNDSIRGMRFPSYPAYIYEKRIEDLNELSPIKLEYNEHVQKYIDAYGARNKEKMQMIISKSAYYFPIFEEYLDKYNLPLELKYLAAVESALDATAVSKSGAVGLWQFMKPTADIFGMRVTSYIDERRDVYKSTDAACQYLKYLYQVFGDWQLALAAYNGGPGTLTRAIARSGGKTNYWELRPYLSNEMQNYVPAFIAMNYLMAYHSEHNIFPASCFFEAAKADTIMIEGPLYLKNVAEITDSDLGLIRSLNPVFSHAFIPKDGRQYALVLPNEIMIDFIEKSEEIYTNETNNVDSVKVEYPTTVESRTNFIYHNVIAGDTLFRLALNNNCLIKDILEWNNLDDKYSLKVGDKLKIFVD